MSEAAGIETFILGETEAIEAEYGYGAAFVGSAPFAVLVLFNGEFIDITGYTSKADARREHWGKKYDDGIAREYFVL